MPALAISRLSLDRQDFSLRLADVFAQAHLRPERGQTYHLDVYECDPGAGDLCSTDSRCRPGAVRSCEVGGTQLVLPPAGTPFRLARPPSLFSRPTIGGAICRAILARRSYDRPSSPRWEACSA